MARRERKQNQIGDQPKDENLQQHAAGEGDANEALPQGDGDGAVNEAEGGVEESAAESAEGAEVTEPATEGE